MATDVLSNLKGMSQEDIAELMGKSRTRNQYGPKLIEFCESDEAGINPAETWPTEFGQKQATTLYQGFVNAVKKAGLGETILVKKSDESVFLLHKDRVAVLMAAQSENGNK